MVRTLIASSVVYAASAESVPAFGPVGAVPTPFSTMFTQAPRQGTASAIIAARNGEMGDHTFKQAANNDNTQLLAVSHYDWWMFPWRAKKDDSPRSRQYSVDDGDVMDLLLTQNFVTRYIASAHVVLEAPVNAVRPTSQFRFISPARHPKILCSLEYFGRVAKDLSLLEEHDALTQLRNAFEERFGQLAEGACDGHIERTTAVRECQL